MPFDARRWFNPSQPQTLQIAVWLLYFNAFWALFSLLIAQSPTSLLILAGSVAAGYGISNEKKWGYGLGLAAAVLNLLVDLGIVPGLGGGIIGLLFAIALVALLLHPQSRDYQRIWFR
jgi:hypothetical protein